MRWRRVWLLVAVPLLLLCAAFAGCWLAARTEPPLDRGMSSWMVSQLLGEPLYGYEEEPDQTVRAVYRQGSEWFGYRVTTVTYGADFGGTHSLRWHSHLAPPDWLNRLLHPDDP
jgi:hypothetical protein